MKVSFVDLKTLWDPHRDEILKKIENLSINCSFVGGKELEEFEKKFADYLVVKHAVGVSSGTSAIEIALRALGIGHGDEVIVPSNTFIATAFAVSATGATPVFCDVDIGTWNISGNTIRSKITDNTRAVIAVHLFGFPVELHDVLNTIGGIDQKKIYLIEDCAQAHGAHIMNMKVGSWGHVGCFSFYPTKNLGCWGEGGAIVTNDWDISNFIKAYINQGQSYKNLHSIVGHNHRLAPIQATVLNIGLDHLDEWNEKRIAVAKRYRENLKDLSNYFTMPIERDYCKEVYHLFPLYVNYGRIDTVVNYLSEKGVATSQHYPTPIHKTPAYAHSDTANMVTEVLMKNSLTLPMHPLLKDEEIDYVCECLRESLEKDYVIRNCKVI